MLLTNTFDLILFPAPGIIDDISETLQHYFPSIHFPRKQAPRILLLDHQPLYQHGKCVENRTVLVPIQIHLVGHIPIIIKRLVLYCHDYSANPYFTRFILVQFPFFVPNPHFITSNLYIDIPNPQYVHGLGNPQPILDTLFFSAGQYIGWYG